MITCGIDGGSRTIKVALYDHAAGRIIATGSRDQGLAQERLALDLRAAVAGEAGIDPAAITATVATGYARRLLRSATRQITEITCHAAGVAHLQPQAASVIEIGGQDAKAIALEAGGRVRDFVMNDRCAAGTGRFLELVAVHLEVDLGDLGPVLEAAASCDPVTISSMCVVFAETEIVGLLASGVPAPAIMIGVQRAVAERIAAMAGRLLRDPVVLTGGVALIAGMDQALAERLQRPVTCCPQALYSGAIGAALLAAS